MLAMTSCNSGEIKIEFDEDMYILPSSGFMEKFKIIFDKWSMNISSKNLLAMRIDINCLLKEMRNKGYLILGDEIINPPVGSIHLIGGSSLDEARQMINHIQGGKK